MSVGAASRRPPAPCAERRPRRHGVGVDSNGRVKSAAWSDAGRARRWLPVMATV